MLQIRSHLDARPEYHPHMYKLSTVHHLNSESPDIIFYKTIKDDVRSLPWAQTWRFRYIPKYVILQVRRLKARTQHQPDWYKRDVHRPAHLEVPPRAARMAGYESGCLHPLPHHPHTPKIYHKVAWDWPVIAYCTQMRPRKNNWHVVIKSFTRW